MAQNIKVQDGIVVYSTSNPSAPVLSPNAPTGDVDFIINGQLGVSLELSVGNDPLADGNIVSPPNTSIIVKPGKDLKIQTPTGDIVLNNVVWPMNTPVQGVFLGANGTNVLEFYTFILGTEGSDVLSNAYLNAAYPAATIGQLVIGPTVMYLFIGSGLWRTLSSAAGLPSQGGNAGKVLGTDGTSTSWVSAGGGGSYTDEQVRDVVGAALVAGAGITITVDDVADTITVSSDLDKAHVYRNTAGNSHTSGWAKVALDTVSFDTNSIWDATNTRFTPKKAGHYQVNMRVRRGTSSTMVAGVGKNGSLHKVLGPDSGSMFGSGGSVLVYCNGTTDYLEPFLYSTSAIAYTTGPVDTWMDVTGPF